MLAHFNNDITQITATNHSFDKVNVLKFNIITKPITKAEIHAISI
ncbi:hypothetical protein ACFLY2_00480 [Patescibacteria group bacterium]